MFHVCGCCAYTRVVIVRQSCLLLHVLAWAEFVGAINVRARSCLLEIAEFASGKYYINKNYKNLDHENGT